MTVLYGDFICPNCNNEQKLMKEINDGIDKLVFPGEKLVNNHNLKTECEYCDAYVPVFAITEETKFVGFLNENQIKSGSQPKIPDTNSVLNKWKLEKTFTSEGTFEFKEQPFLLNQTLELGGQSFSINKIFRTEWVEKDIDIRIEHPRPDVYWYELQSKTGLVRWLKVENVEGNNTYLSDHGIVVMDEKDVVVEITTMPSKIKSVYKTDWFGGRVLEAFQYTSGTRILVTNYKKQVEIDVFEETFEEAMQIVENNIELGIFNE